MSKSKGAYPPRPGTDAVLLHSQPGSGSVGVGSGVGSGTHRRQQLVDIDGDDTPDLLVDDLPPLYSDIETDGGPASDTAVAGVGAGAHGQLLPQDGSGVNVGNISTIDAICEAILKGRGRPAVSSVLPRSADWQSLADGVAMWARHPPRPYLQLLGTHTETVERDGGKTENRKVVDFDVKVDLTPYLYLDARRRQAWCTVDTADEVALVRRGTVFRCQDPSVKERRKLALLEDGDPEQQRLQQQQQQQQQQDQQEADGVREWCRRFCADTSALKCFTLERQVAGFDYDKVRAQMTSLVRRTRYRGHLAVSFPTDEVRLDLYNDHRLNRWRLARWAQLLCALTLLIVFTWPYLFFRTKRYEVVTVRWHFSRTSVADRNDRAVEHVSLTEDQLYNLWARAISKAVLDKRQSVLDQEDLRAAEGAGPTFRSGNEIVDGAVNLLQAGISAMGHINREHGWGGDC